MAQITVTNVSDGDVTIRDLYRALRPAETIKTTRSVDQIRGMSGLHEAIAAQQVTVAVTYTDAEKASGLVPTL
jgi:hypothetical protein